ncbi:endonuclease/exonuclease/phosphatase family protein [Rhizobium halophilum]|uniref:endonuclease/exonuclease/phosphatase family protein n=1 Tax=Rhizobium halophilum TaxID=2846852 RepID=UPI001EFE594E|nr:endonuclease/exonuclease/phosphatase family protein [Rhizobium halophilum]MCF6367405.1 endonuclease/exonuclease/phosphatase family protein [Rhizobium halophilum]
MRNFLSVAICVIVSLVLLAIATRYVSSVWIFGTIHNLQLHLSIASAAALLLALLLQRGLLTVGLLLAALALILHALWMARDMSQVAPSVDASQPTLRLMSFNILMTNSGNAEAIRDLILSSDADVVNIMEAEPLMPHLEAFSAVYPHRMGCGEMTDHCDLMILSKLPLTHRTVVSLSHIFEERMMVARVTFNGAPLHVAAIHTTKPYFDNFQFYELRNAAELLNGLNDPIILSGDFNASSLAPNMRWFLRATGLRKTPNEPATWPVRAGWAGVAIDHVFVRPPLIVSRLERLPDALGSNHYGLLAEIAFAPP